MIKILVGLLVESKIERRYGCVFPSYLCSPRFVDHSYYYNDVAQAFDS